VAIVTGASRGIGQAIAERLAADGRVVVLVGRSGEALEDVRQRIESAGGIVEARACDIGAGEALSALIEEAASTHGRLDILVNNAGITREGALASMSDADFDEVINVNLRSAFVACRAAARPMIRGRYGRIVNVGSVTGAVEDAGRANSAAARAGLIGLTKTLAKELGSKGVTANMVVAGFLETGTPDAVPQQRKDDLIKMLPVRRFGRPEEIAHAVSFVTSDLAGYMTGQVLVIDGGLGG
jgi:3-oxoacyl-[acyl-carrier protein] reductase